MGSILLVLRLLKNQERWVLSDKNLEISEEQSSELLTRLAQVTIDMMDIIICILLALFENIISLSPCYHRQKGIVYSSLISSFLWWW